MEKQLLIPYDRLNVENKLILTRFIYAVTKGYKKQKNKIITARQ